MNDSQDPTVIVKSLKELRNFLRDESPIPKPLQRKIWQSSPRLKLSFSDQSDPYSDSYIFGDMDQSSGSLFAKKHQQSIAGFDITKKIREKDSEILERKTTISILQSKMQTLQATLDKMRIQHDLETETYRKKQMRDKDVITDLEGKVKQMQSKEQETKEEYVQARKLSESTSAQMEKKILQIKTAYAKRSDQLMEELSQLRNQVSELQKEVDEKSSALHLGEIEKMDFEKKLASSHQQLVEVREMQLDLDLLRSELEASNAKNKELELRLDGLQEQENRSQLFEQTIHQLPALRNEIQKLKEENHMHRLTHSNVALLEERLASAESQHKIFENRCKDLTAENASLITLRDMSEQYETALKTELDLEYLPPVSDVVDILRSLKEKDEEVEHSMSELKASLDSHSSSKDMQEKLVKSLREKIEANQHDLTKNTQIIRRLQRKVFLLSKERDSLAGIITSYESEVTLNPSLVEQERISHLEAQLDNYKTEMTKLEEELREGQQMEKYHPKSGEEKSTEKTKSPKGTPAEEIEKLQKVVDDLKEENELLKNQLDQPSFKGDYDPSKTKVIHMKNNPLEMAYQDRRAELDRLTQENEALKRRVKLLEMGDTHDLTQKIGLKVDTEVVNSKQVQELEEKMTTFEIRNKRLIKAFKLKAKEMREVVYQLTGYRVDLRGDNQYRLTSMYAESQEDFLLFQQTDDGELRLLETAFSAALVQLIESYLRQEQSFPAFLSALTLHLFNRQSIVHSSSDPEDEEELDPADCEADDLEEMGDDEEDEDMAEEEEEDEELEEEEEEEEDEQEDEAPPSKRSKTDDDDDDLICLD